MKPPPQFDQALIEENLNQPVDALIRAIAAKLSSKPGVLAILFYGNRMRHPHASGLLDFYILTRGNRAFHGFAMPAFFNWLLPPNVYFETLDAELDKKVMRIEAKVAVMRLRDFKKRMHRSSWDTTLWARFSQPAVLTYAANSSVRSEVVASIAMACETASWWAAKFSHPKDTAEETWTALYRRTYGAELRVERADRAQEIVTRTPHFYKTLYDEIVMPFRDQETASYKTCLHLWRLRVMAGKVLNVIRLIKAGFTFQGGATYLVAKVKKHSGMPLEDPSASRRYNFLTMVPAIVRALSRRWF